MITYEYKVVPAPKKGEKVRGLKTTPDRFAHALTTLMNGLGRDGWEYLRADTLPCEERVGLTGRTTTFQNMLVFRRVTSEDARQAVQTDIPPQQTIADDCRDRLDGMPEHDALDTAARRAGVVPPVAPVVTRPGFGATPRLVPLRESPSPTPQVGPAARTGLQGRDAFPAKPGPESATD